VLRPPLGENIIGDSLRNHWGSDTGKHGEKPVCRRISLQERERRGEKTDGGGSRMKVVRGGTANAAYEKKEWVAH